jgi:hypothetical protein
VIRTLPLLGTEPESPGTWKRATGRPRYQYDGKYPARSVPSRVTGPAGWAYWVQYDAGKFRRAAKAQVPSRAHQEFWQASRSGYSMMQGTRRDQRKRTSAGVSFN